MSRNFDLLQRINQEIFEVEGPRPELVRELPVAQPADPAVLDGLATVPSELLQMVHRVFLAGPVRAAVRCVCFVRVGADDRNAAMTVVNTAKALALCTNEQVCIVDCDPESKLSALSGAKDEHNGSAANAIFSTQPIADFVEKSDIPNVSLFTVRPAGTTDLKYLLGSAPFRARVAELRSAFPYVMIATPPPDLNPFAIPLAAMSDGAILVLEANRTRRDIAQRLHHELQICHVRTLGVVLTNHLDVLPQVISSRF